ncbi:hypothetical protein M422DRAFT_32672 [Sphaerobolus stellatus SS14]|uniref:Uncharacterized protein n=1 Tax=Sphaerobolus stellatus (strain SS14) TaxID=990650 RepID=A0A0C9U8R3_SPHS4|nr:hypothetical protein M422DRAFT_32672 [Sphaerobolus stellatus SS14]
MNQQYHIQTHLPQPSPLPVHEPQIPAYHMPQQNPYNQTRQYYTSQIAPAPSSTNSQAPNGMANPDVSIPLLLSIRPSKSSESSL